MIKKSLVELLSPIICRDCHPLITCRNWNESTSIEIQYEHNGGCNYNLNYGDEYQNFSISVNNWFSIRDGEYSFESPTSKDIREYFNTLFKRINDQKCDTKLIDHSEFKPIIDELRSELKSMIFLILIRYPDKLDEWLNCIRKSEYHRGQIDRATKILNVINCIDLNKNGVSVLDYGQNGDYL